MCNGSSSKTCWRKDEHAVGSTTQSSRQGVNSSVRSSRSVLDRGTSVRRHRTWWLGLVVDALAALTRFRVELDHLEDPLQLCARCSLRGLATYWTRDLEEHLVATPAE